MTKKPKKRPKIRRSTHESKRFHELLKGIGSLFDKKNFDYAAGGQQGPMGNFDRVSALLRSYPASGAWGSPSGVALTYLLKQLDAALILHTTGKHSVTGEGLRERLTDIAAYAIITCLLIEREENK